jgi:prophage antirepressor-like protein
MIAKEFREQEVRLTEVDGELHVAAADVAEMLGYSVTGHFTRHVREKYKGHRKVETPGGPQQMTVISELGIYDGLSSAQGDLAEQFQRGAPEKLDW